MKSKYDELQAIRRRLRRRFSVRFWQIEWRADGTVSIQVARSFFSARSVRTTGRGLIRTAREIEKIVNKHPRIFREHFEGSKK